MSDSEYEESQEGLQRILDAYGQQFLQQFDLGALAPKRPDSQGTVRPSKRRKISPAAVAEDEWTGFGSSSDQSEATSDESEGEKEMTQDSGREDSAIADDGEHKSNVVVFRDVHSANSAGPSTARAQMKAFMSSKASKMSRDITETESAGDDAEDDDEDLTNVQNDAILHRLVHTKLLSGSLQPDFSVKPAKRRKAMAGRVLEIAGQAKLGKGESSVRFTERNKASKRVRDGMATKQKDRTQKVLEEAKEVGNYHPTLKQVYDSAPSKPEKKKRERGLRMGIGSFSGGTLKLGRNDLIRAEGTSSQRGRGKGRGRGGRHSGRG